MSVRAWSAVLLIVGASLSGVGWLLFRPPVPPPLPIERTAFIERTEQQFDQQRATGEPTWIRLRDPELTTTDLRWLAAQPDLARISIDSDPSFDDDALEILARSVSLRHLDLSHVSITDRGMESIGRLRQLRSLRLRAMGQQHDNLTDAGVRHLASLRHLERLDLSANRRLTDKSLETIAGFRRLWSLNLERIPGITSDGLRHLSHLTRLERLELVFTSIGDDGLRHLTTLTGLKHLSLPHPQFRIRDDSENKNGDDANGRQTVVARRPSAGVEGPGLRSLWGLPIERLHLDVRPGGLAHRAGLTELRELPLHTEVGDQDLSLLRKLHRLERLDVTLTDGWGDTAQLAELRHLRSLRELTIAGQAAVASEAKSSAGLASLAHLADLERLRLVGVNDDALQHISECRNLRILDLRQTEVTGSGLRKLVRLRELHTLGLDGKTVTDEGLLELSHLTTLEHLVLGQGADRKGLAQLWYDPEWKSRRSHVTSDGFDALANLRRLKTLDLSGLSVSDEDLPVIARLTLLQVLDLSGSKVSNVADLTRLPNLRKLELSETPIADAGILPLRTAPTLSYLGISETGVTENAASAIYEARSRRCQITDNWCCGCMAFAPVGD